MGRSYAGGAGAAINAGYGHAPKWMPAFAGMTVEGLSGVTVEGL